MKPVAQGAAGMGGQCPGAPELKGPQETEEK